MAKKMNAMRLVQENQGYAELTNRRPAPIAPALYLMQLRLPRLRISAPPRKLAVIMDSESRDGIPQYVKIRHLV